MRICIWKTKKKCKNINSTQQPRLYFNLRNTVARLIDPEGEGEGSWGNFINFHTWEGQFLELQAYY